MLILCILTVIKNKEGRRMDTVLGFDKVNYRILFEKVAKQTLKVNHEDGSWSF